MTLASLYFGKDDAESDNAAEGLLSSSFLATAAFNAVLAGKKRLVIGRKGSGKSAICLRIYSQYEAEHRSCLVTPDDVSADEVRRFELPGVTPAHAKSLLWRYVFALHIARELLARQRVLKTDDNADALRPLRQFLADNGETEHLSTTERFWRIIQRMTESVSVEAFHVKASAKPVQPTGLLLSGKLDVIEDALAAVLKKTKLFGAKTKLFLLVDQLEKVWGNDRGSDEMAVGLLMAANRLWATFPSVQCTLFLRADIYEALQFDDRDKFRGEEIHLSWKRKELIALIEARAKSSLANDGISDVRPESFWHQLFPVRIDELPPQEWLIQRTLCRPRDIIQLCNACRDTAETRGHLSIESDDLRDASQLFSNWKHNDLINEWRVNFPFLADVFVLFSNSTFALKKAFLATRLDKVHASLVKRYPSFEQYFAIDTLLEILFDIGLVGMRSDGKTVYSFEDPNAFQPQCDDVIIHPAFRQALRSERAFRASPYSQREDSAADDFLLQHIEAERGTVSPRFARPGRGSRMAAYASDILQRVEEACSQLRIAQEAETEIRDDLMALARDLNRFGERSPEILARARKYVRDLREELSQSVVIDSNVDATLRRAVSELDKLAYSTFDEFVR